MEKLIDIYKSKSKIQIHNELYKFHANNDGAGPLLSQEIGDYLTSIGITKGYLVVGSNINNQ